MKFAVLTITSIFSISAPLFADDININLHIDPSTQQMRAGQTTDVLRYSATLNSGPASTLTEIQNSYLGPIISVHTGDRVELSSD